MRIHFFSCTDPIYRADFRQYYTFQNLKSARLASLVFFLICVTMRIIYECFPLQLQQVRHINQYERANWASLIFSPLFFIGSIRVLKVFQADKKNTLAASVFVWLFAFFLTFTCMRITFLSMYNPRNTMLMYMTGLIIAAVFFSFEYYETLALTVLNGISFAFMLPFYQHGFNELFINNMASIILLIIFFAVSRFIFSYRCDNFLKMKAIEEKNQVIEKASQVKNEILGVVAHDLRNPLAAIKMIAMIMESDGNMDAENQDNLQMIKASCDKATSIINDLLETAHNDLGGAFELEETELNKFLSLIVEDWKRNKVSYVNILYNGVKKPVYAHINREKMQRVLDNLVSNAVKFSNANGNIEIILETTDDKVLIQVKDEGIGIPPAILPYVFDRFSKASRQGLRGEESVGLGLSIVKQIVDRHGGHIVVDSVEKIGTVFTITLNVA